MTAAFLANVLFSFITSLERREFLKQTRPEESIAFRTPMMQAMPFSPDRGNSCSANVSPFLNDCEHDQAGDIFKWIYGELNSTFQPAPGKFLVFDQTAFSTGIGNGLSREGVVIHTKSLCRERGLPAAHRLAWLRAKLGSGRDDFYTRLGHCALGKWLAKNCRLNSNLNNVIHAPFDETTCLTQRAGKRRKQVV